MRFGIFPAIMGFMISFGSATSIAATLKEPAPISVNPQRNPMQLLGVSIEAIKASRHGWKVDGAYGVAEVSGGYRMRVIREWNNRHVIYSYLTVTPDSVTISYADSRELDFEQGQDGRRKIHGSYNELTRLLINEIAAALPLMCGDFSFLKNLKNSTYSEVSASQSLLRMPQATESVSGTGYVIREYTGFLSNGLPYNCGPVAAVFRDDRLVDVYGETSAFAKLKILGEMISQRYAAGQMTYGQAAAEYKEAELEFSQELESFRQKQLASYYRLLAARLERREISIEEFDYLAIEKEAELKGQQDEIQRKKAFEQGLIAAEREKAGAMRDQASAMQSQASAQHQANFQSFLNGLKTVTCSTSGSKSSSTTTCSSY